MSVRRLARWAAPSVVGLGCLALTACNSQIPPGTAGPAGPNRPDDAGINPKADVGPPLYAAAKPAEILAPVTALNAEPLVVPNCTVQYEERQQVAASVDATIELIGTPLPAGEKYSATDPTIVFHPRDLKREQPYRRLRENDFVRAGQVICFLDDQLVVTKMEQARTMKATSEEVKKYAKQGVGFVEEQLKLSQSVAGATAKTELLNTQATLARFLENLAQAEQSIAKSDADEKEAAVLLGKHRVRSAVNGIVRTISRQPGDFVKQGDKIMEIQATDRVRVEGNLDVQYANLVKRNMPVVVEPALPSAPEMSHNWHRQEVTGIAVTASPARPLVVSVGADGAAIVWDPLTKPRASHNLPHPVPVRCVAATGPGAKAAVVVTGADDGKVRFWALTNPDKLPDAPTKEPEDSHKSAVQAVAASADGKCFATAAGREVSVWDDGGKKLYAIPDAHRDTVTGLSFTPQCTLVTAARDRSLKVWKLGADKAAAVRAFDHRSGAVDQLGVGSDGGLVLFDQDKGRLDLVSLADGRTVASLQNAGPTAAFSTLAVFGPKERLILTAGGEGELKGAMQVWITPAPGGRGSEIARLVTPGRADVTCASFASGTTPGFLVAGTRAGGVHLWKPPADDARKAYTGVVTKVDSTDPRYVTVRVEMDNRELGLLDRSAATVIITPSGQPGAGLVLPPAAAPVHNAAAPAAGPTHPAAPAGDAAPAGGLVPTPAPLPVGGRPGA